MATPLAARPSPQGLAKLSKMNRVLLRTSRLPAPSQYWYHNPRSATANISTGRHRPRISQPRQRHNSFIPSTNVRSIFIQSQTTPNPNSLKFLPNHPVLPEGFPSTFLEYTSPRSTLAPPHPSPLASKLLSVDGVSAIFYGPDFITVTKADDINWAHIKPEVFSLITEAVTSGEQVVNTVDRGDSIEGQESLPKDSLAENEEDDEVVAMIKELLETRIRPAIQEDGGDIEYRGFEDGMVSLKLRGACRTCDSSTVTLKNGIESMLMHYIEEVKGVNQVLDEEEEIALKEFARFEEKLRQQKGPEAVASTVGKGSLDFAE